MLELFSTDGLLLYERANHLLTIQTIANLLPLSTATISLGCASGISWCLGDNKLTTFLIASKYMFYFSPLFPSLWAVEFKNGQILMSYIIISPWTKLCLGEFKIGWNYLKVNIQAKIAWGKNNPVCSSSM